MSAVPTRKGRVSFTAIAAAIALSAVALAAPATSAGAAPPTAPQSSVAKYVALGDSYAAGQGGGGETDPVCLQSPNGYPVLLDAEPRLNLLRNAGCSGSTIAEVAAEQLSQLNRGTTLVTLTVGANDLQPGEVYLACASGTDQVGCQTAVTQAQLRLGEVAPAVSALLAAVHERAPRADIVVTGYPRPFAPTAAFQSPLAATVNEAVGALDASLAAAVGAAQLGGLPVVFVPVDFGEHAAFGQDAPWLGGDPGDPITFLHPNATGYAVYRDAIAAVLS